MNARSGDFVPVYRAERRRVKQHTKRQLHKLALAKRLEEKAAAKGEYRREARQTRRDEKALASFVGIDPERTLGLIGDD